MTTTTDSRRLGIAIDLDQLQVLAGEYLIEMGGDGDNDIAERLTLSSFIQWLRQRQLLPTDNNLLTFRIEKGGADGTSGS